MLKDLNKENLIIPPWDPRYGKLGHIWKKYNWDNLVYRDSNRVILYFIPPELVINEKIYSRGWKVLKSIDYTDEYCNWSSSKPINNKLIETCELNNQDYFDLLILKINNKLNRPRCNNIECNSILKFSNRIFYGYNQTYPWNESDHAFCCKSCSAYYQSTHPNEFENGMQHKLNWINARYIPRNKIYTDYRSYLNKGNQYDECNLYISLTNNGFIKYGVTTNIENRRYMFYSNLITIHKLIDSYRFEIANIEAKLKFEFKGREYLNFDELHKFFNILKSILANRPVASPFN